MIHPARNLTDAVLEQRIRELAGSTRRDQSELATLRRELRRRRKARKAGA